MRTSIELRQQRARVVESLRAITEAAEAEDRNLTAEERQAYDRHEQEFRDLTERVQRVESEEQRAAEQAESLHRNAEEHGTSADQEQERGQQVRSAFLNFVRRGGNIAPEQRALIENSAGEILVPEDLETEIYRALPSLTVMRELAGVRTTQRDRVRRRSLDEVTVGWGKLETAAQTLTDSMPSTPTEAFTYVEDQYGLAKIGEDEFDDTDVALEAFVRDSFARACGESEDTAFTIGTGHASNQPVGWTTTAGGITAVTGSGALADYSTATNSVLADELKALVYAVPAQYRRNGAYVVASSTELAVSQLKDANGGYRWQQSLQAGRPNTFNGYAMYNQEDVAAIAASKVIAGFGDWKAGYRILDRLGMTVQRLVELYAEEGMIGFKIRRRVGGDVVRPDALRVLKTPAA